jgi:hypothetical protein
MYIHSGCLGNLDRNTALYEVNDSCWFETNIAIYSRPTSLIRPHQLEACVVARLYYKKHLNVSRNLALFYHTKYKNDNPSAPLDKPYRQLMNDRFVLNSMIPELKFLERYHRTTMRYVLDPKLT